jgi:hypothetical protein
VARVVFTWELGAAFGHVTSCVALARALEARGHAIAFVFRELGQLAALPEASHYEVIQAPLAPGEPRDTAIPVSYADILLASGYGDVEVLAGLTARWCELLEASRAGFVVADTAPTALLAARVLGIKRANFANGFAIPPPHSPLPAFRHDIAVDADHVRASDARALANVNEVLARFAKPPLPRLADLFATDEDFLCTFPEIDHYGSRPRSAYWGPRYSIDSGADVRWTYGEGKRVLVYVRDCIQPLDALIEALAANRCRVAAFIPGIDAARRERLRSAQRIVSDGPMRLEPLLQTCDLVVSEGGNISAGALMSGVPQLLFPSHYEQFLTALRIEQVGSALWLPPDASADGIRTAMRRIFQEPRFKASAQGYTRRYPSFSPAEQTRRIVLRIEEILSGA